MSISPKGRATGTLIATCVSALVVNANTSAVSILLPSISDDTGMSVTTLQWAVTGYSLVGAATSARVLDLLDRDAVIVRNENGAVIAIRKRALLDRWALDYQVTKAKRPWPPSTHGACGTRWAPCPLPPPMWS